MQLGFVGLGKMGANMVQRLLKDKHELIVFDLNKESVKDSESKGASAASSLGEIVKMLKPPRAIWIMVPVGAPVQRTIDTLFPQLSEGDILIDGGNSFYKDSVRRANQLKEKGIHYVDVGTSGGVWGLKEGFCMMIGAEENIFHHLEPLFKSLAPEAGYALVGSNGAGHLTKMVHNGIEYGLMEAYAEGFEILAASDYELNLHQIAELWNHGGVVRSWLLELIEGMFEKNPRLQNIRDYVEDSGMGRWTVLEAMEKDVPAPAITLSLQTRFRSRQEESFSAKVLAALRHEFGGHAVKTK